MTEPFKLGDIRGEVKALTCLKSFKPDTSYATSSLPVKAKFGNFGVSIKKEDGQPKGRHHVFQNIWERKIGYDSRPQKGGKGVTGPEALAAVNWKNWPPPIPEIVPGIKIPVEFTPQIDYKLSQTGLWREVDSGLQAKPLDFENSDFFKKMQGSLNMPQSHSFSVSPPSLLFLNSKMGEYYTVTLKLKNNGGIPRRIRVISPNRRAFQVLWGSDLKEKTLISPGLTTRISVQFRPDNNKSINDILMIVIDGDGAVIVPMMSASASPPILETTEWDCGCSTVGNERAKTFEIKNVGGDARFWILSEEELRKEYLAVFREFERKRNRRMSDPKRKESCITKIKLKFKLDQVYTRYFRLYPSCFRLQRNQKIDIKVRYTPKDANFHYEKLALLCDNGEVRWIAMRGMGLDTKSPGILELKGNWTAPPCDLPTDINANYIIDCGDLIPGETATPKFTVINKSCLPLYFFWSLRPIQGVDGNLINPIAKNLLQHHIEGSLQVEWEDYDLKLSNSRPSTPATPMKIFPAQGIIEGNEEVVCTVVVDCPQGGGYHAGILSIFVEQVNAAAQAVISSQIQELERTRCNDIPIYYEDLIQTMPQIQAPNLKLKADLYKHFHPQTQDRATKDNLGANKNVGPQDKFKPPHHARHKKRSAGSGMFNDESPAQPIYMMQPKKTNGPENVAFQLTQLQFTNPTTVEDEINNNKVLESSEYQGATATEEEEEEETKPEPEQEPEQVVDVRPKATALNLYRELMQRQQLEDEAKKTGNYEPLMAFEAAKKKEANAGKENPEDAAAMEKDRKPSDTSDASRNEGMTLSQYFPKKSQFRAENFGGTTSDMNDYIRRSISEGPKMWLKDTSALMPVKEVEIWMRSVPLQCWFYPPFIIATGTSGWVIERTVHFHNHSNHQVDVEWERLIDEVCSISCEPQILKVKASQRGSFRVQINFQKFGKIHNKLNGTMRLPFAVVPCSISLDITTSSPSVEVLTPLLSFGLLTYGTEKVKSLAIKNTGIKKAKWRAKITDDALEGEANKIIATHQTKIVSGQLVRVWPEWGILDPGEVAGAQVYFSAEIQGRVATSIEVTIDDNPNLTTYVTVCAEVQSPCLFFEDGFCSIPFGVFLEENSYTASVNIINPTGFFLAFSWQCPIGRQSKFCTLEIEPKVGFVAPKSRTQCRVTVINPDKLTLHNLFVPCCVEGMKEPLVLKIFTTNS